jgi:hypothetical protein
MATRSKVTAPRSVQQSVTLPAALASEVLRASHHRFINENEPARKNEAGRDLIREIFGNNAIAENQLVDV